MAADELPTANNTCRRWRSGCSVAAAISSSGWGTLAARTAELLTVGNCSMADVAQLLRDVVELASFLSYGTGGRSRMLGGERPARTTTTWCRTGRTSSRIAGVDGAPGGRR